MTDEGRAEEYVTTIQHDVNNWGGKEPTERFYNEIKLKQAYLAGLAEGRKELEQWKQEWQDAQIKANEEGFARTTLQIKYSELEKENEKLKAEKKELYQLYEKEADEMAKSYSERLKKLEEENAELKKEISVLLSCSNCSDNKGGYICDKEYNDKCLAQKIEHIKELEKENAELKKYCDCEYCHKYNSGDEFTVEGTNKTLCEYCLENNKKFFEV